MQFGGEKGKPIFEEPAKPKKNEPMPEEDEEEQNEEQDMPEEEDEAPFDLDGGEEDE